MIFHFGRKNQPFSEVEKYIEKIALLEDRYELYCELGQWRKACDIAVKLKDNMRLTEVRFIIELIE